MRTFRVFIGGCETRKLFLEPAPAPHRIVSKTLAHRTAPFGAGTELGLREAWNTLVDRMECPEVFYTYEWARAVVHAYADSLRPWLLLVHEGTELLGVAALAIDLTGRARFLCGTTADYCDLVSDPKDRSMLVEVALTELCKAGIHDIVLANLPRRFRNRGIAAAPCSNPRLSHGLATGVCMCPCESRLL